MSGLGKRVAIGLVILICVGAGRGPASRPAPAGRGAAVGNDPLVTQAISAVGAGKLDEFARQIELQLTPLLVAQDQANPDRFIQLCSLRQFGRYFGKMKKLDSQQADTLRWLLGKPHLLNTLMMAVAEDFDEPDRVLAVLTALKSEPSSDRLDQWPDLVTALCVVWDNPATQAHAVLTADSKQADVVRPRQLLRYYLNNRQRLRIDPQTLPWELAIYLVDNPIKDDEIIWALQRYGQRAAIGGVFFDVSYDQGAFRGTSNLRLDQEEYTLQNILRVGGVCGDQAYFAAHVARSVGVPATICTGKNSDAGTLHAWVGFLDNRTRDLKWNFEEGRYPENRYWSGNVVDPQTRETITDAEVSLLAELVDTPASDRLMSAALWRAGELADKSNLAGIYMRAISLSPGNRQAWYELAVSSRMSALSKAQKAELDRTVAQYAAKKFPDFAFTILRLSIRGHDLPSQIKALDVMRNMFRDRPDLFAKARFEQGDLYLGAHQPDLAMAAYSDVLANSMAIQPVIQSTMERVDSLYHQSHSLRQLAEVYRSVWQRMPQAEISIAVTWTPYYRIGEAYERLLNELGDKQTAAQVRARLDALTAQLDSAAKQRK